MLATFLSQFSYLIIRNDDGIGTTSRPCRVDCRLDTVGQSRCLDLDPKGDWNYAAYYTRTV